MNHCWIESYLHHNFTWIWQIHANPTAKWSPMGPYGTWLPGEVFQRISPHLWAIKYCHQWPLGTSCWSHCASNWSSASWLRKSKWGAANNFTSLPLKHPMIWTCLKLLNKSRRFANNGILSWLNSQTMGKSFNNHIGQVGCNIMLWSNELVAWLRTFLSNKFSMGLCRVIEMKFPLRILSSEQCFAYYKKLDTKRFQPFQTGSLYKGMSNQQLKPLAGPNLYERQPLAHEKERHGYIRSCTLFSIVSPIIMLSSSDPWAYQTITVQQT